MLLWLINLGFAGGGTAVEEEPVDGGGGIRGPVLRVVQPEFRRRAVVQVEGVPVPAVARVFGEAVGVALRVGLPLPALARCAGSAVGVALRVGTPQAAVAVAVLEDVDGVAMAYERYERRRANTRAFLIAMGLDMGGE